MATENLVYTTALSDGMPDFLAKAIVAQSRHETGDYSSDAYVYLNNLFGYSYVDRAKWQLPTPGFISDNGSALARYENLYNSVHELTDWIKRRQNDGIFPADLSTITTLDQYARLLKDGHFYGDTVTNYLNGLKRWFTDNIATVSSGILIVAAILLVWMINRKRA